MFVNVLLGWFLSSALWFDVYLKKDYDKGNVNGMVYSRKDYFILVFNKLFLVLLLLECSFLIGVLYFVPIHWFMVYALEKDGQIFSDWDLVFCTLGLYPIKVAVKGINLPNSFLTSILNFFAKMVRCAFDMAAIFFDNFLSQPLVNLLAEQLYNLVLIAMLAFYGYGFISGSFPVAVVITLGLCSLVYALRLVGLGSGKLNTAIDLMLRVGQIAIGFSGLKISFVRIFFTVLNVLSVSGPRLIHYFAEPLAYIFSSRLFRGSHLHRKAKTVFVEPVKLNIQNTDANFWQEQVVKRYLGIDDQGGMSESKVHMGQYLKSQHKPSSQFSSSLKSLSKLIESQYCDLISSLDEIYQKSSEEQQTKMTLDLSQLVELLNSQGEEAKKSIIEEIYRQSSVCASGLATNLSNFLAASFPDNLMQSYVFQRQCNYEKISSSLSSGENFELSSIKYVYVLNQSQMSTVVASTDTSEVHRSNLEKALVDPAASRSLLESDITLSMFIDSCWILPLYNMASYHYSQPIDQVISTNIGRFSKVRERHIVSPGEFYAVTNLNDETSWAAIEKRFLKIMQRQRPDFNLGNLRDLQYELLLPFINNEKVEGFDIQAMVKVQGLLRVFLSLLDLEALGDQPQIAYRKVVLPFLLLDLMDVGIMLRLGDSGAALSGPQDIESAGYSLIKSIFYGAWLWLKLPLKVARDTVMFLLSMCWEMGIVFVKIASQQRESNFSLIAGLKNLVNHLVLYMGMSIMLVSDLLLGSLFFASLTLKHFAQGLFIVMFYSLKLAMEMISGFFLINYQLMNGIFDGLSLAVLSISNKIAMQSVSEIDPVKIPEQVFKYNQPQ